MKKALVITGRHPLDQDTVIHGKRISGNQYVWPADRYTRLLVTVPCVNWVDGIGLVETYERGFCRIDGRTARLIEYRGLPYFRAKHLAPEIYSQLLHEGRRNKAAALQAKYGVGIKENIP